MLRKSLGAALVLGLLNTLACSAGSPSKGSTIPGSGGTLNLGSGGNVANGTGGQISINVGGDSSNGGGTAAGGSGNSAMQCDGKFKGYLRDFTIGDAMGNVMLPGSTTPTKLLPDGSTAWWTGPTSVAPTAETVGGVVYKVSPDFEVVTHAGAAKLYNADDKGIVATTLGADQTPVYAGPANGTVTTTGAANFATWFHNTAGINVGQELDLQFVKDPSKPTDPNAYTFSSGVSGTACAAGDTAYCSGFYPIDGMLLGNEGNNHNYHMTFELHLKFKYSKGQVFSFTGDDDVWAYINSNLAVNLGGLHRAESQSISLDTLGLTEGTVYPLDFFWCERHVTASNFHIDTSLEIVDCGTVVVK